MRTTQKFSQIIFLLIIIITVILSGLTPSQVAAQDRDGIEQQFNAEGERHNIISLVDPEIASTKWSLGGNSGFTADSLSGTSEITTKAGNDGFSKASGLSSSNADYFVAPDGSDSNSCNSPASPCQTINAAIAKAAAGNTIAVASGTYTGSGTEVVLISKAIRLLGGWNSTFSEQNSTSIIDGHGARRGISNTATGVVIEKFTIQNGFHATMGGGVYSYRGTLTLNNSIVTGNVSEWMGGGIYSWGSLTVNNSSISRNRAGKSSSSGGSGGAGIYSASGQVVVNHSSVSGNSIWGNYDGSGIYNSVSSFELNNSTVSDNTGSEGIYISSGPLTLNSSTVSGNSSGGIYNGSGTVTLQNSILASNSSSGVGQDCYGVIKSSGHNLIDTIPGCNFTTSTGDQINVDPLLSSHLLGVIPYHALLNGSPAIDAGNPATCLTTDQRGVSRPQGSACDIGAYEYSVPGEATSIGIVSGSNQRAGQFLPFSMPLKAYVVDSVGSPVSGVNVTFTAPASGASGTFTASGTNSTTVSTNEEGVAISSTFTANSQLGAYNVIASVSGLSGSASFVLTNASWFVSPAGSDSNVCSSSASPCLTITGAISKALPGDAIKVAIGTYTGSSTAVVNITQDQILSGGWNASFTSQDGSSTINGQNARRGIYNTSANISIDHFIIRNGYATSSGGGVYNSGGSITINNSLIIDNQAKENGGGIFSEGKGNISVNNSTIRNNSSSSRGGGIEIYHRTSSLTLSNSTVTGNQSNNYGGGISFDYSSGSGTPGIISIQNSTIVKNRAALGGGIYNSSSSRSLNVKNGIIANNTASSNGPDCYGTISSLDHSLLSSMSNCSLSAGPDSLLNTDPLVSSYPLGILAYHALQPASPVINAGANCPATDQRGVSRPQGAACDMGAYEFTPSGAAAAFGISDGSNQRSGTLRPFSKPLVVYVVDSSGSPVSDVEVTFTAPASGTSGTFADSGTNSTTVFTDDQGAAVSSIFTANSQWGTYNVMVTVPGISGSASFVLMNADWFVSPAGSDSNSCSTPSTPCVTINGAIGKAFSGDQIRVAVGTYTAGTSAVASITKDIILSGGWNSAFSDQIGFSVIDGGGGTGSGISSSAPNVTISRFIVRAYKYGIYHSGGALRFEMGALLNNNNGIYNYDGDTTFINTTISGNHASGTAGSAISNVEGKVTVQYSTITNNSGSYAIYNANGYAYFKIGNSILAGNSGGDCYIGSNPSISEGNNIFGRAPACSGSHVLQPTDKVGTDPKLLPLSSQGYHPILSSSPALDAANSAVCPATDQRGTARPVGLGCEIGAYESDMSLAVTNTNDDGVGSLRRAIADAPSGAIIKFAPSLAGHTIEVNDTLTIDKDLVIDGSNLSANIKIDGKSIIVPAFRVDNVSTVVLKNLDFVNGSASGGGAIRNLGTLSVYRSTFSNNLASSYGGAIENSGTLSIAESTFIDNYAEVRGGAIFNDMTLTITNSTFTGNNTPGNGGGIYNSGGITIVHSTFSNNGASLGGSIFNDGNLFDLKNTILANSASGGDCYNWWDDTIDNNINSLIETNGPLGHQCGTPTYTADPMLASLENNGGPTQTFALLPGSPAIDTGDSASCASTDQRGVGRPKGAGCDIGAFELEYELPIGTNTNVSCAGPVTYGSSSTCTATVTRAFGINTPAGTVSWASADGGAFTGNPCTLTGTDGSATCSVTYTPSAVGDGLHGITVAYSGDTNFAGSSGSQNLSVETKAVVPSITASNKVYNGTTTAAILTRTLSGVVSGDAVSLTGGTATFNNKNVGNGKTVTASGFSLSGAQAGNYHLSPATATTAANITARGLTVSAAGVDKVYDGTTSATVTLTTNALAGDSVTAAYTSASFATPGTGNNKSISVSGISISGADAGNYNLLNTTASTSANITQKPLTITADDKTKVAGEPDPDFTYASGGFVGSDTFTTAPTCSVPVQHDEPGEYDILCSGGAAGPNYTINYTNGTLTVNPPSCYILTLGHKGQGSDPVGSPSRSAGCPAGQYVAGVTVNLSGATPESGWQIGGWSGTEDDASTASTNTVTMPAGDHSASVMYLDNPPGVLSVTRAGEDPTSAASVDFVVTFSEPVTGVDATVPFDDFALTTSGAISGAAVTGVVDTGDQTSYTVIVATGSGDGTIRLDVVDDDSIQDENGDPLGGPGTGNGDFTSGETYTIDKSFTSSLQSIPFQDGWLLESSENSSRGGTLNSAATVFLLGDNAQRKQYRSILSFSTKGLPDNAIITKVTLKVKKQGITGGGNPVNAFQGFMVDVRKGFFGSAPGLQASDFQAGANKSYGPFKPALSNGWYTINLTPAKAHINKLASSGGVTQIRLRFKLDDNNNALANYLKLYSGNAPEASRPQLIIEYYVP